MGVSEAVGAISDYLKQGRQVEGGRWAAYNKAKKVCSCTIHHAKRLRKLLLIKSAPGC